MLEAIKDKKKRLDAAHTRIAPDTMCMLNSIGAEFARLPYVTAMTDVTGFGLMRHLTDICEGSGVGTDVIYDAVPKLPEVEHSLSLGRATGGAQRNFAS